LATELELGGDGAELEGDDRAGVGLAGDGGC